MHTQCGGGRVCSLSEVWLPINSVIHNHTKEHTYETENSELRIWYVFKLLHSENSEGIVHYPFHPTLEANPIFV